MTIETHERLLVNEEQRQQYQREGYMILERAISPDMLTLLREECSYSSGTRMRRWT